MLTANIQVRSTYREVWKPAIPLSVGEPLRQSATLTRDLNMEVAMPVALKREPIVVQSTNKVLPWIQIVLFCAAGLFVSILAMTYGLDLRPGLF